jgi:hypothetical protein
LTTKLKKIITIDKYIMNLIGSMPTSSFFYGLIHFIQDPLKVESWHHLQIQINFLTQMTQFWNSSETLGLKQKFRFHKNIISNKEIRLPNYYHKFHLALAQFHFFFFFEIALGTSLLVWSFIPFLVCF